MISTRSEELVIDTVVCLTLAKWETVSGRFGGYLTMRPAAGTLQRLQGGDMQKPGHALWPGERADAAGAKKRS
jgi:hypothetical protein